MANRLIQDMVGAIAYTLTVDGKVIEHIDAQDAIEYLHGFENIVPGLEAALEGKTVGDTFEVSVAPADGYGEYDEEMIEIVPRSDFEEDMELEVGAEVEMMDDEGDVWDAVITAISDDEVTLDFNPPLAGKTLIYKVQVVNVREASEDELDMGMPESMFEDFDEDFDEDEDEAGHRH